MNSSEAVSVGSLVVAASTAAMSPPTTAVTPRITLLARRAVSLIHSARRAAGTAPTSADRVRTAELSLIVHGVVGMMRFMVLVLWERFVRWLRVRPRQTRRWSG